MTNDQMPKKPSSSVFVKTHRSVVTSTRGMSTGILLGSSFAVATGGFGWLGHQGDLRYDTEPWMAVGGVCLGFLYGGYEIWKLTREPIEASEEGEAESTSSIDHEH